MKEIWNEYERLTEALAKADVGSKEYSALQAQLEKLVVIQNAILERAKLPESSTKWRLLENAPLVGGLFTFGTAFMMLNFERSDIITSSVRSLIRSKF